MTAVRLDTPIALTQLVSYQDGSVVSQTLVKSKAGSVTIFAFDEGEALSEHTAPFDALIVIVDGRATVTIAGTKHALRDGQTLRLPAGIPHSVHADTRFRMLLIMIRSV